MPRTAATQEQRVEHVDEAIRTKLLVAAARKDLAEAELEKASVALTREIERAQKKASLRDIAAVLQVPHTRLHHWLKPYKRTPAARAA